jgi:hypothetical protein
MSNDEYWDESEFGFFETLEDEDKLLYLYDLMIGDFVHEYVGNGIEDVFEIDFEEEPLEPIHQNVTVSFDDTGNIVFAGSNVMLLRKVATDMIMNGLILQNSQLSFEDDAVKLTYELVGKSEAISLN